MTILFPFFIFWHGRTLNFMRETENPRASR